MQPRPFQAALIEKARDAIRAGHKRILIQLPTGGGKTFIAACIMQGTVARRLPSWFIAHRKELLSQTADTFGKVGLGHGWIATKRERDDDAFAQLVGVQYVGRRLDGSLTAPRVIITDECHHATAATYTKIYEQYPDAIHIGLSATPERLDGTGLGDTYEVMIEGPSVAWLIANNYLSPYRYFAPGVPDLTGVRTRAGDYASDQLSAVMGDAKLIGDAVDTYFEKADGAQGITFGIDRAHSRQIAEAFQRAGIAAEHIDGSMDDRTREKIVGRFRAGELQIMCNVDLFGEGFDVPNIGYLGMFRPTQSLGLCMQQWGRALRTAEGKVEAIICDHAGNAIRHGLPHQERKWSLEGHRAKGKARTSDALAVKTCPECYTVDFSTAPKCVCGYVFKAEERPPAWAEGELLELHSTLPPDEARRRAEKKRKDEERACQSQEELYDLAIRRGYKKPRGWAKMKWAQRRAAKRGVAPKRFWRGR